MGYFGATAVLLKKNALLSLRDVAPLLVALSSPFFAMLILYFSQLSLQSGDFSPELRELRNPVPQSLQPIPRCIPFTFDDCNTIAYVPDSNPDVSRWVTQVAARDAIPDNEIISFQTSEQLNLYLVANPNRTQAAYIFEPDMLTDLDQDNVHFIVQYNDTLQTLFPLGNSDYHTQVVLPSMIHSMNLVIMSEKADRDLALDYKTSVFPHPNILEVTSGAGLDAFGNYGPLLVFATYFLALVFFLYKIVLERERGLRAALQLAGQYQSQHYISWTLPYVLFMLVLTLLLIAFGHIFNFKFFTETSFIVYFLTMFIFALSLIGWTMLLATLIKKSVSVSSIAFNLFITGYVLATSGSIVYALDQNGEPIVGDNVLFLRELFAIFPSTVFVKALNDATRLALTGFGLNFDTAGTYTDVFPVRTCWGWMIASGLVTFFLSIYFDNILPSEHGAPLHPLYPFQPSYWGLHNKKQAMLEAHAKEYSLVDDQTSDDSLPINSNVQSYNPDEEDHDVRREREAVASGERDVAPLVLKNITKSFNAFKAVDDVSFSVRQNSAFALLGHNGAGKSVTFKIMTTSLAATTGEAFIYGHSVRKNVTEVRKLLGVCPQFDIFWDKLTGAEHIEIFAALKGLTKRERQIEIDERLADVKLSSARDRLAGNYSGGMQRRLSVAVSLTGNPKIVFLDECTSGADPLVRRDLWATLERAKKGRVLFLITHSIAEAQHIAGNDSIGIMAKGKLRVLGTALHLKHKFGAGYKVLVVLRRQDDAARLCDAFNSVCQGTVLSSTTRADNGDTLADYALPRLAKEREVLATVRLIEVEKETFAIVQSSVNSATLDDVFKSITSLSEDVHEDEDVKSKKCCCL